MFEIQNINSKTSFLCMEIKALPDVLRNTICFYCIFFNQCVWFFPPPSGIFVVAFEQPIKMNFICLQCEKVFVKNYKWFYLKWMNLHALAWLLLKQFIMTFTQSIFHETHIISDYNHICIILLCIKKVFDRKNQIIDFN